MHSARVEVGRRLAKEHPVEADLVIPVPESGHPGRDRLRRGVRHPLRRRAWSRTPTSDARSSSRRRRSASSASGSSSTRCATSSAASGWSSSTTRSCAATPSGRWSGCCARPARSRCTCASPPRRSSGRASTASTSPREAELVANGLDDEGIRALDRRRLARLRLAREHDRRHRAAARPGCAGPASTAQYPIALPDDRWAASTCSRASRSRCSGARRPRARARRGLRRRGRAHPPVSAPAPAVTSYAAAGVDIEAGDRAVELMKAAVERTDRPGVARRPRRLRRAVPPRPRQVPAAGAGQLDRRRRHQARDRPGRSTGTTRSASTWSRWWSTTWSSSAPSRCS